MTFDNAEQVKFSNNCTTCAICGKTVYVQDRSHYTYKMRNKSKVMKYMCSYSCYNKAIEMMKKFVPTPLW